MAIETAVPLLPGRRSCVSRVTFLRERWVGGAVEVVVLPGALIRPAPGRGSASSNQSSPTLPENKWHATRLGLIESIITNPAGE
jgi:hypothetical protein